MPGVDKVPKLVVFGGLPGVGKTTIARRVAQQLPATYLRIDAIEEAIRKSFGTDDVKDAGYLVGYSLAKANLTLGHNVVADNVNPLEITRAAWRHVAADVGASLLEIEVVCSNRSEHRRRVEGRVADIPGSKLPDWKAVADRRREYEARSDARLVIDTATVSASSAISLIIEEIETGVRMS
ncbi:MAG TPA: AAA family ATPase [Sphingomicrobium sp.]|nr:AAA family ATPase [Sphingomicrobium sp.]